MAAPDAEPMPLGEAVEREAMASVERRRFSRMIGATVRGGNQAPDFYGNQLRDAADALARDEALKRMSRPSEFVARAKADWPKQCKAVAAYAEAEGIGLGEAWARAIDAGVRALRGGRRK
jgi:hypothetical protein